MTLAADYQRDGFVVCHGLVDEATFQSLREETVAIATGRRGAIEGVPASSGEGATDRGEDSLNHVLAIHFPHKVSPPIRAMLTFPPIVSVLNQVIGPDVKCMQSMLFVKSAGKPGQAWHQDETFIPTRDASLCGVWIAIDDATVDNGCLWVQPGSHKPRQLWPSRACGDPRFDGSPESFGWESERWPSEGGLPVEVVAGSVVFFNGYTLHRSLDNRRKTGYRRALVNHCMSARGPLPWPFCASAFAPEDYRDIVMVSGSDPFESRGVEDLARPFVRKEKR